MITYACLILPCPFGVILRVNHQVTLLSPRNTRCSHRGTRGTRGSSSHSGPVTPALYPIPHSDPNDNVMKQCHWFSTEINFNSFSWCLFFPLKNKIKITSCLKRLVTIWVISLSITNGTMSKQFKTIWKKTTGKSSPGNIGNCQVWFKMESMDCIWQIVSIIEGCEIPFRCKSTNSSLYQFYILMADVIIMNSLWNSNIETITFDKTTWCIHHIFNHDEFFWMHDVHYGLHDKKHAHL